MSRAARSRIVTASRRYLVVPLILLAVSASFLPLSDADVWWIRFLDFPRVQIATALLVLLSAFAALGGLRGKRGAALALLAVAAIGYHAYRLHPYIPLGSPMAVAVEACDEGDRLDLLVANVQKSNRNGAAFLALVRAVDPDVLVVLETDAWWDRQLQALDGFSHRHQSIPSDAAFYGMHLVSRLPLHDVEKHFFFGEPTPTLQATVELPAGARVAVFGLHPRPPHWSQPATMRDGHLARAALAGRESDEPVIFAGDLNATPWERTNRRAMRLAGLLDPRVGRGLVPTYGANTPGVSWPLDQILFQEEIGLRAFRRLPSFGSDHYPVLAELCVAPGLRDRQSAPPLLADDIKEAQAEIEAAQAMAAGQ